MPVRFVSASEELYRVTVVQNRDVPLIDMNKWFAGPPRWGVLSVSVADTIPVSISCAVCVAPPVSVSISVGVSVPLPSPFLVSKAFASTIVVPTCASSRVVEISHLYVIT